MGNGKKTSSKSRQNLTLGPIADLESHLPQEWWKELFDSLYLRTDGDVVENDANTQEDINRLLEATNLHPDDALLDLCCGQGRHVLALAARNYTNVTGLDRSRYLVRLARKRSDERHLTARFQEGDVRKLRFPEGKFNGVYMMGNSFGYFDQEADDLVVLKNIKRILRPGGVFALDITDGAWMRTNFEPRSWEWIDQKHFVCRERSLSRGGDRLITREVITHSDRGVIADQFYAERLYTREGIKILLEKAAFEKVEIHSSLKATSDRGGDLGMMANRIFVTSRTKELHLPKVGVSEHKPADIHISVLLGDSSLPDPVKLNGQFNDEDFDTINRLKKALGELDGFSFSYLDRHDNLSAKIKKKRPQLVLNLCDEGLRNDPFMELHVPALLEMEEIPYTGAGPACLGLCYDKALVRSMALAHDIPVPLETYIRGLDSSATLPSYFPALLKPAFGDSSIGITKNAVVHNAEELMNYVNELRDLLPNCAILVQEFLSGTEYSVSLIGNPETGFELLPILEVDYSALDDGLPKILGYESKWEPESPYWNQIQYKKTTLHAEAQRQLVSHSCLLFELLRCRDYARFDFRTDANGIIKLLEVNPNPGWCWDGKFNLMGEMRGWSYSDLLHEVISAAQKRYKDFFPPHVADIENLKAKKVA